MQIGVIGLGGIGKMVAKDCARAGYDVCGCDLPEKRSELEKQLQGMDIEILKDGIAVARRSDLLFYCVPAETIDKTVEYSGRSVKQGAIVSGQTSVKTPEVKAFEEYLPKDVNIVPCHSLHGPTVEPPARTLAVIRHPQRSEKAYRAALNAFEALQSKIVEIPDYQTHDQITADTQANTQTGFLSMATAWKNCRFYPWENQAYVGGIDNVKILMALRILANEAHVYSGIAILNPFARQQIGQYAQSETDLFKLIVTGKEKEFRERIEKAGEFVFSNNEAPIMLDDRVLGEFSLGNETQRKPNSHLSLLAMVDAWYQLGVNPYKNMICQTPLFRLRLGIVEYLFRNPELLEESINAALFNKAIRGDDLEFHTAVREWATIVGHGDIQGYQEQFNETKAFFRERIPEGMRRSSELIKRLA
jgi:prephenate dehydrogenase (NADP+)